MPVSPLDTATMEAPGLATCSSRPPSPQVLPPVELKLQEPGMAKSPALDMEGNELPWQEVRNKRRSGLNLAPPSPTRGGEDRAVVFRRRVRGRCFRCLAPDHRVAGCYGDIRCLSCNCSGHRERDCPQRLKNSQAPRCFKPPPPARCLDGSCSWAEVAAARSAPHAGGCHQESLPKKMDYAAPASPVVLVPCDML